MRWFEWAERSEVEIEAEIADELEFHLEQRTRALVEEGLGAAEARAEAERRFGSVERVRKDCRWVQLGERIMLQRIQVGLNVVLVVAVGALGLGYWRSNRVMSDQLLKLSALLEPRAAELAPQASDPPDPRIERFKALKDPQEAAAYASELAALRPSDGCYYMREGWGDVKDPLVRIALLEPFVSNGGHANATAILHLAATDADARVRERAFACLKTYALQDFTGKPASIYHEWYSRIADRDLSFVFDTSAESYAQRLRAASGSALVAELGLLEGLDLEPARARGCDVVEHVWQAGGEENVQERAKYWLASGDPALRLATLRFIAHVRLDPDFVRICVAGFLTRNPWPSDEILLAACRAFASCGRVGDAWPEAECSVTTLRLLRLCIERDSAEIRGAVGEGLLAPLLGLAPDAARGGAQWAAQWKELRKNCSTEMLATEDARWLDAR